MIPRKKKVCSGCGELTFIWSKGRCKRCTALDTPPAKKKKSYLKPISDKQAERLKEYREVRDEFLKLNPTCLFKGCKGKAEVHHSRGRVGDNLTDVSTFRNLCRKHHMWVEVHPKEAKELGLTETRLKG